MTRYKVSNQECAHLWANQAQGHADGYGNIWFSGNTLNSYRTPIGRIVQNARGETAYLLNTYHYSSSTAKHQGYMRRAIPHGATTFAHDRILDGTPAAALRAMIDDLPNLRGEANRARSNKEWKLNRLASAVQQVNDFAAFFDLPHTPIREDGIDAAIAEAAARYEEEQRQALARTKEREAKRLADAQEYLSRWMDGNTGWYDFSLLPYAYLRVCPSDPSVVETTHGARVPLADVQRAAPIVLSAIDNGHTYESNQGIPIGPYRLSRIQTDGTVIVGCHTFEAAEVRRFAATLPE